MKLKKILKWSLMSLVVGSFAFICIIFLSAIINLKHDDQVVKNDNVAENVGDLNEVEKDEEKQEVMKDTDHPIRISEYDSFKDYVTDMTKHFNGESELIEIYTIDNFKYHLVVTSANYLRHFEHLDEVPKDLHSLVDEGIKSVNDFENGDDPSGYFEKLKDIHNELNNNM